MTTVAHRYADAALDRLWDGFTYLVMNGGREPMRTRVARHLPALQAMPVRSRHHSSAAR
jgi:hypothetical protein